MSSYSRSIRRIDRTPAYEPVQAVTPYAYYPYRDAEPQQAPDQEQDWNRIYRQAASSAASWIQTTRDAQDRMEQLANKLSQELNNDQPIKESLHSLITLLNQLETSYTQRAGDLTPELWSSIELAMRHPAAKELGLSRSASDDGQWSMNDAASGRFDSAVQNANRMKRLLLGSSGLLTDLKLALAYTEQQKPSELLQSSLTSTLPYGDNFNSIQNYPPVPYAGLIINQYI